MWLTCGLNRFWTVALCGTVRRYESAGDNKRKYQISPDCRLRDICTRITVGSKQSTELPLSDAFIGSWQLNAA